MFGVVLWSDAQERKGVIWCEDHGDLAYYRQSEAESGVCLDRGDWVQFDLTQGSPARIVCNPRLLAEDMYVALPNCLNRAAALAKDDHTPRASPLTAQIVPFAVPRRRQR